MKGIQITATGRYVPKRVATNEDFTKIVDTSDEWITKRTGMKERHIASGEPTWVMGAMAARNALEQGNIDPLTIDLIVVTSVTPDYYTPAMSCLIQANLGAANAICFDMNAACSGYVYALDLARRYLSCGDVKRVLIVSAEALSRITDYTDRASCVLFGDAAAACVVEAADALFASHLVADGTKASLLYAVSGMHPNNPFIVSGYAPEYDAVIRPETEFLHMDGPEVYKFAVKAFPAAVRAACEKAGIAVADLDLLVPHQANIRIVETAAKQLGFPMEKTFINMEKYGNTSSACAGICLDELNRAGRLQRGQTIAVAGFGAGVTAGCVVMRW